MMKVVPAAFLLLASCAVVQPVLDIISDKAPSPACVLYGAVQASRLVLEAKRLKVGLELREATAAGDRGRIAELSAEMQRLAADIEAALETEAAAMQACASDE